jgi:hypothetical protein
MKRDRRAASEGCDKYGRSEREPSSGTRRVARAGARFDEILDALVIAARRVVREAKESYIGRTWNPTQRLLGHYERFARPNLVVLHWSEDRGEIARLETELIASLGHRGEASEQERRIRRTLVDESGTERHLRVVVVEGARVAGRHRAIHGRPVGPSCRRGEAREGRAAQSARVLPRSRPPYA